MLRKKASFKGFHPESIKFLNDLQLNNNRDWFENHRDDYRNYLLEPFKKLVSDLDEFMLTIDPLFETAPSINKTISRIYRDTRFSKDKSLFRSSMWLTFKRKTTDWKIHPSYFFEIMTDYYRYGMGFYNALPSTMKIMREDIDNNNKELWNLLKLYKKQDIFGIAGENYKKINGKNLNDREAEWYRKKNIYMVCNRDFDDQLFSPKLTEILIEGFDILGPFYHYFIKISSQESQN